MIGYKFNKSIAGTLFNYKETLCEEVIDRFENNNKLCNCSLSPYKDINHGHVITGNLDIVENRTLKTLISKGPKYRLPHRINWEEDRRIILAFLDEFKNKQISKERRSAVSNDINGGCLDIWKKRVLELVDKK